MAAMQDFYGNWYDDVHPAFIVLPNPPHPLDAEGETKFVFHRTGGNILDIVALQQRMADADYTPGPNEIGEDDEWLVENTEFLGTLPEPPIPPETGTVNGITFTSDGAGTSTLTITLTGTATADFPMALQGLTIDGAAVDDPPDMGMTESMPAAAVAIQIAGPMNGKTAGEATITATNDGAVVTFTNDGDPGIFDANPTLVGA